MKTGISSAYMSHLAQVQTATFKYWDFYFLWQKLSCAWKYFLKHSSVADQWPLQINLHIYDLLLLFLFFYLSHYFTESFLFFCSSWKSFLSWVFLTSTRIFWRLCLKCKLTQKYRYWNKRESCLTHVKINKRFVTPYVRVLYTCLYTCL